MKSNQNMKKSLMERGFFKQIQDFSNSQNQKVSKNSNSQNQEIFKNGLLCRLNTMIIDKVVLWSFNYPLELLDNNIFEQFINHSLDEQTKKNLIKTNLGGSLYSLNYFFKYLLKYNCEIILEPPNNNDILKYNLNVGDIHNEKIKIINSLTQNSLLIMIGHTNNKIDYNSNAENPYISSDVSFNVNHNIIITKKVDQIASELATNTNLQKTNNSLIIYNFSCFSGDIFMKKLNIILKIIM